MPGLCRRRDALRRGDDWTKSKKSYRGGGHVVDEHAYGGGGRVKEPKRS